MSYDPLYPGGRFWSGPGGIIVILSGICYIIGIPLFYISLDFKEHAHECIGCETDAFTIGHNLELISTTIIVLDCIIFGLYLIYLYYKQNKTLEENHETRMCRN